MTIQRSVVLDVGQISMALPTNERKCVSPDAREVERYCPESQDTRAHWIVDRLVFIGAVRDVSGRLVNVLAFRAGLRFRQTSCEIDLRVDARALARLLEKIGPRAIREPRMIAEVVEDLLSAALSARNCGCDTLHASKWEFGETTMSGPAPAKAQRHQQ